jgi:hypothetical protein
MSETQSVLRYRDIDQAEIAALLQRFQLEICLTENNHDIPGSYWGHEEAGLIGNQLHIRTDTPLHSILHESCHYVCMDKERRENLNTNAGGGDAEENAVCYLQILLVDSLSSIGRNRLFADMDRWGYSFRLGSAKAWFEQDAQDAQQWLLQNKLIDERYQPLFRLRETKKSPKL